VKIFNNSQTRLQMTLLMIGLALIEGLIKQFLTGFPLTEVFALQGTVYGGYIAVRTMSNMNEAKYANGGDRVDNMD